MASNLLKTVRCGIEHFQAWVKEALSGDFCHVHWCTQHGGDQMGIMNAGLSISIMGSFWILSSKGFVAQLTDLEASFSGPLQ